MGISLEDTSFVKYFRKEGIEEGIEKGIEWRKNKKRLKLQ